MPMPMHSRRRLRAIYDKDLKRPCELARGQFTRARLRLFILLQRVEQANDRLSVRRCAVRLSAIDQVLDVVGGSVRVQAGIDGRCEPSSTKNTSLLDRRVCFALLKQLLAVAGVECQVAKDVTGITGHDSAFLEASQSMSLIYCICDVLFCQRNTSMKVKEFVIINAL